MRTGNDVFRRAMSLLGYTGADGAVNGAQSAELFRRGLNIVNQVMADIWPLERTDAYIPLSNINDDIPLSQRRRRKRHPLRRRYVFGAVRGGRGKSAVLFQPVSAETERREAPASATGRRATECVGGLTCVFQKCRQVRSTG